MVSEAKIVITRILKAVEEEGERFREAVVAVVVLFSRSRVVHVVRRRHIV